MYFLLDKQYASHRFVRKCGPWGVPRGNAKKEPSRKEPLKVPCKMFLIRAPGSHRGIRRVLKKGTPKDPNSILEDVRGVQSNVKGPRGGALGV